MQAIGGPEVAVRALDSPRLGAGSAPAGRRLITGGIVAHNDEDRIERSIRSLLDQRLPDGTEWGRIWVVASGCTDGTTRVARSVAGDDPRVGLVVESERRGKASAIGQVLRRAEGESLVLLNSDAVAAPGAVEALLDTARGKARPYAVMGRPTVPTARSGGWTGSLGWMWDLHHELHLEMLAEGKGRHLSDELWLVSLPVFPWIEDGIINDGSYCAVWLRSHGGSCWYAPEARVAVEIPSTPTEHLRQRRRIHVGNAQVADRLGRSPTTVLRFWLEQPSATVRSLRRTLAHEHGWEHLARIGSLELVARALSVWDRLPPRRDHVLWQRIGPAPPPPTPPPAADGGGDSDDVGRRIRVLAGVAAEFGVRLPPDELTALLPASGPRTATDLASLLERRPDLNDPTIALASGEGVDDPRRARGIQYQREARRILDGPLRPLWPWIECLGVTGSAAYGSPEAGDDLDFFVVVRRGAVPTFLAATYLALRLDRLRHPAVDPPVPCFNYVVDSRRADREFARGRGLLFAREALTARMLRGDPYYRALLARAPGLARELPRLYAARASAPGARSGASAPVGVRILSLLALIPLAGFLQCAGLVRNWRARRAGRSSDVFRTRVGLDRLTFESTRFEQLRSRYEDSTLPAGGRAAAGVSASR